MKIKYVTKAHQAFVNVGNGPHLCDVSDDFLLNQSVRRGEITDEDLGLLGVESLDFFLRTNVLAGEFLPLRDLEGPPAGQGSETEISMIIS